MTAYVFWYWIIICWLIFDDESWLLRSQLFDDFFFFLLFSLFIANFILLFKVHRANFKVNENTRICSLHFLPDDYVPEAENRDKFKRKYKKPHLKENAVPSVDMCTSHLKESKFC